MFWLSFALLCYVYLGYPLFLLLFARHGRRRTFSKQLFPSVTFLISVYNETAVIDKNW
jgi:hypothetical protein